jgi:hypothetical protein
MIEIVDSEGRIIGLVNTDVHNDFESPEHGRTVQLIIEPAVTRGRPITGGATAVAELLRLVWHRVTIYQRGAAFTHRWYLMARDGVPEDAWKDAGLVDLRKAWKH